MLTVRPAWTWRTWWRVARPVRLPARRSKFGAVKTVVDGITFASKREASRYQELCLLQRAGHIRGLTCQVRYPLDVNGTHIADYVADFCYAEVGDAPVQVRFVVEDCKGMRTPIYRLKKKLMLACHGITIRET